MILLVSQKREIKRYDYFQFQSSHYKNQAFLATCNHCRWAYWVFQRWRKLFFSTSKRHSILERDDQLILQRSFADLNSLMVDLNVVKKLVIQYSLFTMSICNYNLLNNQYSCNLIKSSLVRTKIKGYIYYILMLRAAQNEKQLRQDLLGLLQTCVRKRGDYGQRRQELRNIQFEQGRNDQDMTKYEQNLQGVLTDGDLEGYKKIGGAIGKCSSQRIRLAQAKQLLQRQMESIDTDILSFANSIQEQFHDILSDVLPSDCQCNLKTQRAEKTQKHCVTS